MSCLACTERCPWTHYITTPVGGWGIIEMIPRWIDQTTLQVALSNYMYCNLTSQARMMRMRKNVPNITDALKWCAERRMAVKLVCVETPLEGETLQICRDLDVTLGHPYFMRDVLSQESRLASHRLVFKSWQHAFEFKMRWC